MVNLRVACNWVLCLGACYCLWPLISTILGLIVTMANFTSTFFYLSPFLLLGYFCWYGRQNSSDGNSSPSKLGYYGRRLFLYWFAPEVDLDDSNWYGKGIPIVKQQQRNH